MARDASDHKGNAEDGPNAMGPSADELGSCSSNGSFVANGSLVATDDASTRLDGAPHPFLELADSCSDNGVGEHWPESESESAAPIHRSRSPRPRLRRATHIPDGDAAAGPPGPEDIDGSDDGDDAGDDPQDQNDSDDAAEDFEGNGSADGAEDEDHDHDEDSEESSSHWESHRRKNPKLNVPSPNGFPNPGPAPGFGVMGGNPARVRLFLDVQALPPCKVQVTTNVNIM